MYMPIRSRKSLIKGQIEPEHLELFALELGKIAESDFVHTSIYKYQPFPKQQILDASKLRGFAEDNLKFNENGIKFYRWVENTVGKGEIASPFPSVFIRILLQTRKNQGLFGKGLTNQHQTWSKCM